MPHSCPDCKSQMQSDGVFEWCPQFGCSFVGYVVARTGKVVRDDDQKGRLAPDGSLRGIGLKR